MFSSSLIYVIRIAISITSDRGTRLYIQSLSLGIEKRSAQEGWNKDEKMYSRIFSPIDPISGPLTYFVREKVSGDG